MIAQFGEGEKLVEYAGFVSDVIRRSEDLLKVAHWNRYDATALIMLMMCGFAIPYERLGNWDESDPGLNSGTTRNRIKKLAEKVKGGLTSVEFPEVDLAEWKYYKIEQKGLGPKCFRKKILPEIVAGVHNPASGESLKSMMWCMRNALAHGGIHPLSPRQIEECRNQSTHVPRVGLSSEINRVFLVSKIEASKDAGIIVIDVPLPQVKIFWEAWKNLLISEISDEGLADLDNIA